MQFGKALLPAALLIAMATCTACAATVVIDPSRRYQTILGWGATIGPAGSPHMPEDVVRDVIRDAVQNLGLTRLRLERGPHGGWEPFNDNANPYDINWRAFRFHYVDARARWIVEFRRLVESRGDPFNLYVSPSFFVTGSTGAPPVWLLKNPAEYSEFAIALLTHLRRRWGLEADLWSVCNEPGNHNPFTPQVMAEIIKTLGPSLRRAGFKTKIEFPECICANASWRYIQGVGDDPEFWRWVGVISWHLYGKNDRRADIARFAAAHGIPTAQTEFIGANADHLYADLTDGMCSYWELYVLCGFSDKPRPGCWYVINLNRASFSRCRQFWGLWQTIHYVRPGAVRIHAATDDPTIKALAFDQSGRIIVVLCNRIEKRERRSATIFGLPPGTYGLSTTSRGQPSRELGLVQVPRSGKITIPLPPDSVTTLYAHPGGNLPPLIAEWCAEPRFVEPPGKPIRLSVIASDPEGAKLSFRWRIASQPRGASARIENPSAPTTAATGLTKPGMYVFEIAISDGQNTERRLVRVPVYASNQPPIILDLHNRLPVQVRLPQTRTELRGAAVDVEGDPISVRWSILSQPPGADARLEAPDKPRCPLTNLTIPGNYTVRFEASDGHNTVSATHTVTVLPARQPPRIEGIEVRPAAAVRPGSPIELIAHVSDPSGDPITHWWSVKQAPPRARVQLSTPGLPRTRATGLDVPGRYVFELRAFNQAEMSTATVQVQVQ